MNFGKLIINTAILGPIGYGMGYVFGWLLQTSPILFGAGFAVAFVALSMRPASTGSASGDVDAEREEKRKRDLRNDPFVQEVGEYNDPSSVTRRHWLDRK